MAQCPAHDDTNPSLSVTQTATRARVHCFAGCEDTAVLDALGLGVADLYNNPRQTDYRYTDTAGLLLRTVTRTPDKQFRQKIEDKTRVTLYQLPQVTDAVRADTTIYLVEGEEDVHAVEAAEGVGTTAPMGSGSFGKVDVSPLTGARVVAVVDRDDAGRKWAAAVKARVGPVASSLRFAQARTGKDFSDHWAAGHGLEDLVPIDLAPAAGALSDDARGGPGGSADKPASRSAADALVDLAEEVYRVGVTAEGEPFAVPRAGGHVVRLLRGGRSSLRAELAARYRRTHGKVPPQQALADALMVLEGEAHDTEPAPVHLRTVRHDGAAWVDMGDTAQRALKITPSGWAVVDEGVPVLFRRTATTGAHPTPAPGGDLSELWDHVAALPEDQPLVLAWLVAATVAPDIAHPVLALLGEHGTGKTTALRRLTSLVDPSPVGPRSRPRAEDEWITAASGSWALGLDNVSSLPGWMQDAMCRAVTGDSDTRRRLYTDAEEVVYSFRRCLAVTGIDLGQLQGDLADRLATVTLDRIDPTHRQLEEEMEAVWRAAHPRILGGLLDLAAGVMAAAPSVRLDRLPRMADYARILAAVDQIMGTTGLERFAEQAAQAADDSLTGDPFAAALVEAITVPLHGVTAAEVLARVTPVAEGWRPPRGWPATARAVTGLLRRHAPALRSGGWTVESTARGGKNKVLRWAIEPPPEGAHGHQASAPAERRGKACPPRLPCPPQAPDLHKHPADKAGIEAGIEAGIAGMPAPEAGKAGIAAGKAGIAAGDARTPTGGKPAGQRPAAGMAGKAGMVSPSSLPGEAKPTCHVCGRAQFYPGRCARCETQGLVS